MIITVTGGAGLTGQCAVRDLLRSNKVTKIIVADLDPKTLAKLKKNLSDPRIVFRKLDVTNRSACERVLKGSDLVINAVQYYFNLDVMAAAYAAKVSYLDFGGLYHTTLRQLKLFNEKFRKKNIIGVAGMGAQPGVSNLMIKHALTFLDQAETIEIRDAWRDMTKTSSPMYFTWSPQTFFDESSQDAIVLKDGRLETRPPFSEPESMTFPEPVGTVSVYQSLHSELATIPGSFSSFGVKNVSWKEGGGDFWKIKFLADLGLTSNKKVDFDGKEIAPRSFLLKLLSSRGMLNMPADAVPDDYEITRVIATGSKSHRKKRIVVDCHFKAYEPWRVSCGQYSVGVVGSTAAQMLLEKFERLPKGVFPPERVFEPRGFFAELEKKNISINHSVSDL